MPRKRPQRERMSGISAPPSSLSPPRLTTKINPFCSPSSSSFAYCVDSRSPFHSSDSEFRSISLRGGFPKLSLHCRSSSSPPGAPGSGDNDSRTILDAFFLGKALAEAINERIESTVGELLSAVGRLQAEQQKQVQEFQDDVFERAKRAKEKAAREAREAQGLIPNSTTAVIPVSSDVAITSISPSSESTSSTTKEDPVDQDPFIGKTNDD
ncbi:uncharacterized protein At4g13200, chloroplastic-like [Telopea speciosissima]|uniref:uncharacterized protein At4g13200, chloroplastic-like n=1 Tax=Telopea speciosissima TaxID=54955 RepID=UPI001CC4F543|nr:uncharacterized protein At4g13200, chloroplastic-like [Telopea speciosissima]